MLRMIAGFWQRKTAAIPKTLLLTGCLAVLAAFGCVRDRVAEPVKTRVARPRAEGLALAGKFRAVVIADVDNDGFADVVGGVASPGAVTISYGDGRGKISEPQFLPVKGDVHSVAVADFNEDGLPDIVFSVQKESFGIGLWLNQSGREWKLSDGPVQRGKYESVKAADVNGDGHVDIIAANSTADSQGGIQVWLGDGQAGFPVESGPTVDGIYMGVLAADLNGDGHLDLIGAGWGVQGALRVWLGSGTGNWTSTPLLGKGHFYALSSGDLNGDGKIDIFAGTHRKGVQIFLGDGQGSFSKIRSPEQYLKRQASLRKNNPGVSQQPAPSEENRSYWQVLGLDLDRDGRVDILAGSLDGQGIKAWRNQGRGAWAPFKGIFPATGTYYGITAADLNADGQLDVCAASFGEGIKVWPSKKGAFKLAGQRALAKTGRSHRQAAARKVLENHVFKTINGVAEYKIDPGDTLEITLWEGTRPKREDILVRPDGKISFGFVEDLPVKGLTPSQLDDQLTGYLKEYVRHPRIDVVVKKYNSKFISLMGAIKYTGVAGTGPGKYHLTGKKTVLEMITQAGGPAKDANLKDVKIRRRNGRTISLNLYKTMLQGDLSQNAVLDDGDLVFLPTMSQKANRVYVFGEVEKPGAYTFSGAGMRLFDAISEAGGTTVFAASSATKIVRGDPTRPEIMNVNLKQLVEDGDQTQNLVLASGDLVYVPRNGFGSINLFAKKIRPLMELILWPARIVNDWDRAVDVIGN